MGIVVRVRWAGIVFLGVPALDAGPFAPFLVGMAVYLGAYNGLTALARRRATSAEWQLRIALVSFAGDIALVLLVLAILRPDPLATAAALIPFLAVSGAAHFRTPGSVVGGVVATLSHTALVGQRSIAVDGTLDLLGTLRQGGVFAAVTALIVLVLAELDHMRDEREALGREKAMLEAIARQASYDSVTGLPNRSFLRARASEALDVSGATPVALLVVRIATDEITSTFGYSVLDDLRRAVAERLVAAAGPRVVARLVADEYAVLAVETDGPAARALGLRILRALEAPFELAGTALEVAAAIGIATAEDARDAETLIRRAGIAEAVATAEHGGIQFFEQAQDRYDPTRLSLLVDLRRALDAGELGAVFQPKVRLSDGTLMGAELLARWRHPVRGPIPPGVFVPLAEASLLRQPLLRWSIDAALSMSSALGSDGRTPIAVNISPRDLLDPTLPKSVDDLLHARALGPDAISLEVTEGAIMDDPERCIRTLSALRSLGIRLAVDDFGTGHSSLMYLHRLPVQEVKIDRSFVADLTESRSSRAVVRAAITLARETGLEVIAEGVETHLIAEALRELGCDGAQGYLYAPPLPPDGLRAWMREPTRRDPAPSA